MSTIKTNDWIKCPKCGLYKTYEQTITGEWYCWHCHYKSKELIKMK